VEEIRKKRVKAGIEKKEKSRQNPSRPQTMKSKVEAGVSKSRYPLKTRYKINNKKV
jgi:hypothetical protein